MKSKGIRVAVAITVFGAVLLSLACGTANQNGNQGQGGNQDSNTGMTDKDLDACKDIGPTKPTKIDDEIKNDMSTKLKGELGGPSNPTGSFKFQTYLRSPGGGKPDFLEMYVEGTILGKDEFHDFVKLVKKSMKKDGSCVRNVYFVAPGTSYPPPQPTTTSLVNPEWSYCEPPNRPCSDGSCDCSYSLTTSPNAAGNSMTTSNTNSKAISNSNSSLNTNSKTNANSNTNGPNP